ncbi:hypothetical protein P3T35_005988 [Kitasatospora sp. GP30]|uniref:DUF397 domain-containing protein n=1 Tax=Kitasatospora sp. GP30 TaxID=3035084 RepID=UPI000C708167|nr:DUF397 domain-containing protein [Kitasatospora sp. GP30]MDH6143953.1 hypothetical protein [Kitasatospora sp. GP30]
MSDWQKSSFSGSANECVEIRIADGMVEIRESDSPEVIVRTTPAKWAKFLQGARAGEFDMHREASPGHPDTALHLRW